MPQYKLLIPENISDLKELIASMMLDSPRFVDKSGSMRGKNLDTTFYELDEGLRILRGQLGAERYLKLAEMSKQMRAYFEADPEDETGDAIKGRDLILDMLDLLKSRAPK
jgi:hypothetical protein